MFTFSRKKRSAKDASNRISDSETDIQTDRPHSVLLKAQLNHRSKLQRRLSRLCSYRLDDNIGRVD